MESIYRIKEWFASPVTNLSIQRNAIGWTLVILNLLSAINSTVVFLFLLNTGITGWLMLNTCAPCIFLFCIGFVFRNPVVMTTASVLMLRYGTGGLFSFGWDTYAIPMQIGHILMTLAVLYTAWTLVKSKARKTLATGIVLGVVILVPFTFVQAWWINANPEALQTLIGRG